jgi:hypothetical protein
LKGWLGLDREHVQFLRPEYALNETDLHEQSDEQFGNWLHVKRACIDYTRIHEFLDTPLDEERLVVIHIDTAEAELAGYDVVRPTETGVDSAIELRKRVAAKLDEGAAPSICAMPLRWRSRMPGSSPFIRRRRHRRPAIPSGRSSGS